MSAVVVGRPGQWLAPAPAASYLRARRAGAPAGITSAGRTRAEQQRLYDRLGPDGAAVPGTSRHEVGYALDLPDEGANPRRWFARYGLAFGWVRTIAREPWHFEYFPQLDRRAHSTQRRAPVMFVTRYGRTGYYMVTGDRMVAISQTTYSKLAAAGIPAVALDNTEVVKLRAQLVSEAADDEAAGQ
jgi:hypothetical protein